MEDNFDYDHIRKIIREELEELGRAGRSERASEPAQEDGVPQEAIDSLQADVDADFEANQPDSKDTEPLPDASDPQPGDIVDLDAAASTLRSDVDLDFRDNFQREEYQPDSLGQIEPGSPGQVERIELARPAPRVDPSQPPQQGSAPQQVDVSQTINVVVSLQGDVVRQLSDELGVAIQEMYNNLRSELREAVSQEVELLEQSRGLL